MSSLLSYFYDAQAKRKIDQDSLGNYKIEFKEQDNIGSWPPRAGVDTIYHSGYVQNTHHYPMELVPRTADADLRITEWPEYLEPGEIGKVVWAFSPSPDRTEPLQGGSWDFELVVYSSSSSSKV